jgi:hypothetical protein
MHIYMHSIIHCHAHMTAAISMLLPHLSTMPIRKLWSALFSFSGLLTMCFHLELIQPWRRAAASMQVLHTLLADRGFVDVVGLQYICSEKQAGRRVGGRGGGRRQ